MLIHLIADFGAADLAFAEVTQRLRKLIPEAQIHGTTVPPFATIAAGFCTAQLALNPAPAGTVIFTNVAPRKDDAGVRQDNAGEGLALARLPGGVTVVGVNAGHAFSFLAPHASDLRQLNVSASGSQFRSRDNFPEAIRRVVAGDPDVLGAAIPPEAIPPVPEARMAYVDGFGNIKTTISGQGSLPESGSVNVTIGGVTLEASVASGSFGVSAGGLALSVGSSGWDHGSGGRIRFRELFLRGASAWEAFGRPAPESQITISPAAG